MPGRAGHVCVLLIAAADVVQIVCRFAQSHRHPTCFTVPLWRFVAFSYTIAALSTPRCDKHLRPPAEKSHVEPMPQACAGHAAITAKYLLYSARTLAVGPWVPRPPGTARALQLCDMFCHRHGGVRQARHERATDASHSCRLRGSARQARLEAAVERLPAQQHARAPHQPSYALRGAATAGAARRMPGQP